MYKKESSRITVQFIDADTENLLFEVTNRNWTNVGEIFTDVYANELIQRELKGKRLPENIMVVTVANFKLEK